MMDERIQGKRLLVEPSVELVREWLIDSMGRSIPAAELIRSLWDRVYTLEADERSKKQPGATVPK